MITLQKTSKPLHTMTDTELDRAVIDWESAADRHAMFYGMRARYEMMVDVFTGERLRRIESFLRS